MKKFLCALLAVLALFSLTAGIGYGLAWYRSNHVTVGEYSYYIYETELDLRDRELSVGEFEVLQAVIPGCDITWNVPFQGSKYSSDTKQLTVSTFTQRDMDTLLTYFPYLEKLDASGCSEYALLGQFQQQSGCEVSYEVDLGGKSVPLDTTALTLENGQYTQEALLENLQYLPQLTELTLRVPELTLEQIGQVKEAYQALNIRCTVEILGQEYDDETTALDLSALAAEDIASLAEKLAMLPKLETVELMKADGTSALTKEEVKTLVTMAPNAAFHYTFDFYGTTLSTDSEEVEIKNVKIGDGGEKDLRLALDLMPNCKRFVLDNCGFSNEVLAKVREDYRSQTKVVWRIWFATRGTCLTDTEIFRCVGNLHKNNKSVKYCEDVVYMDIGHNDDLKDISFIASMPKLRAAILSGSSIRDLEPFANCKELEFLELVFCGYIEDLTPLKNCTNLRMLNVGNTKVVDLSPLDDLKLTHFGARRNGYGKSKVPTEEQERFLQQHPNCWATFDGDQPYGTGWRYEEDNIEFNPYYQMLRIIFRYDLDPNDPKQVGLYISQIDDYLAELDKKRDEPRTFEPFRKAVTDSWAEWDKAAQAATSAAANGNSADSNGDVPDETTDSTEETEGKKA